MKAIITRYLPATDTKPGSIKATDEDHNSITISYDHSLNQEEAHAKAAKALCVKMGWTGKMYYAGKMYYGGLKNGYVFTFVNEFCSFEVTKAEVTQ